MIKFLKQKNRKEKGFTRLVDFDDAISSRTKGASSKLTTGFTLIETLVALSIFLISIVGIMTVLSSGLTDINSAKKKMTATFLAQEGIEYVRNIRDTYVLYSGLTSTGWADFNNKLLPCMTGIGCSVDDQYLDFYNPNMPIENLVLMPCAVNCPLYYDEINGKYNSSEFGVPTTFSRTIKAEQVSQDEVKISATVSWGTGTQKVTLSENLFNWVE
jgi:prepilin-type N-terminal cleavage/methylation domain-containing protein